MTGPRMEPSRRRELPWRFSLGEILVAVAIDAVLVASVLDYVHILNNLPPSYVYYGVRAVAFGVVPCVVVPVYLVTYALRVPRFRRWHTGRNSGVMALDIVVIGLVLLTLYRYDSNRTRHIQLIADFVAIGYTMFVVYMMIVDYLKRERRPPQPTQDSFATLETTNPRTAAALPERDPSRGPNTGHHPNGVPLERK